MFDALGNKLNSVFKNLRGLGKLTEANVREAMREVRLALLEADVNFKVVKEFVAEVTEKSLGQEVLESISPGQQIIGLVHLELIKLLGERAAPFELKQSKMNVILLLGLQGSGKTTFAGKLASRFAKQGWKPLLVACDIHRPAAIRQLHVVGESVGVPAFDLGTGTAPTEIVRQAKLLAQKEDRNLLIVDTAGRLHVDEVKMDELKDLKESAKPDFAFLVADAMTGQDAVNSASRFHEEVGIDGVCLTKIDGDARGGAALSVRKVTGRPIFFVGTGEKLDDLEAFYPDRMASRILGMGDVVTLFEKAQEAVDEKQAIEMQKKLRRATFTLQDFMSQMQQVRKMGPLKKVLEMIPGVKQMMGDQEIDEKEFGHIEAIIQSMTPDERDNPSLLNGSRRLRIAKGSGMTPADINALLSQFEQAKRMMQAMMGGGGAAAMRGMGGMGGMVPGGARVGGGGHGQAAKKKRKPRPKRQRRK